MRFPLHASPETSFLLSFAGLHAQENPVAPFDMSYGKFSGLSGE